MAMARTTLRRRSGDIVRAIQLADRTGIVAASAPPAVNGIERRDITPATTVVLPAPVPERPAMRRVRRNLLLGCVAALFLIVGWIAGGTFGQRATNAAAAPAAATGAVTGNDPADTPAAPHGAMTTTKAAPSPATSGTAAPRTTRQTSSPTAKRASQPTTATSELSPPRQDLVNHTASTAQDPLDAMAAQFQQVINSWIWVEPEGYQGYRAEPARTLVP
jgi:hypothetical protein